MNHDITGKEVAKMIEDLIERYVDAVPSILDKIKSFGYKYVTRSGITWAMGDLKVPEEKPAIAGAGRLWQKLPITLTKDLFLRRSDTGW